MNMKSGLVLVLMALPGWVPLAIAANEVPFTSVVPVIDGDPSDHAWGNGDWININQLILGTDLEPADFTGRYKLTWTEDRLYLLAEITDDVLYDSHPNPLEQYWDDDALEIFIDEDASGGNHQFNYNAFAYHVALDNQAVDIGPFVSADAKANGTLNFRTYPEHINSSWKRSLQEPHRIYWEVEIAVFSDDYRDHTADGQLAVVPVTLHAGKTIGFMLAYCDSDGRLESGAREHFIGDVEIEPINGDRNRGYIDADVFGQIRLVD